MGHEALFPPVDKTWQELGQKWTFLLPTSGTKHGVDSVAVSLQLVNAARLMAALLHNASLDLGLIVA